MDVSILAERLVFLVLKEFSFLFQSIKIGDKIHVNQNKLKDGKNLSSHVK